MCNGKEELLYLDEEKHFVGAFNGYYETGARKHVEF